MLVRFSRGEHLTVKEGIVTMYKLLKKLRFGFVLKFGRLVIVAWLEPKSAAKKR